MISFRGVTSPSPSRSNATSPRKELPSRASRPRRNSNISEESGITPDKKSKTPAKTEKAVSSSKQKKADSIHEISGKEKRTSRPKDDESDRSGHNDNGHNSDSDEVMENDSDASGPQDDSSGYESESESGEVRKRRPRRRSDSKNRTRGGHDSGRKYPKRAIHKTDLFEVQSTK